MCEMHLHYKTICTTMNVKLLLSVISVVLVMMGLFAVGNSNAPPLQDVISTENIRIESNYDTGALMAVIYYDDAKVYNINSWETALAFNNTQQRLHQWFSNSTDPKKVEYSSGKDYKQLKVYFYNETAEVTRAGYILRLWNNETIDITFFADTADDSKLGRTRYALNFADEPESISLQKGTVYVNDGESNHIWKKGLEMPAKNEFQVFDYSKGSARLDYAGAVEVCNLFKWKNTQVYMKRAEDSYSPISITFSDSHIATPVQLGAMVEGFNILINNFDGNNLPSLTAWETWVNYNGTSKRMAGWATNNDMIWFNEHDEKKVETFETDDSYSMKVYWYNASKDPSMLGYLLINPKDSPNLTITMFGEVKYPERLKSSVYGIKYEQKYDTVVTPAGDVLTNDGETIHQFDLGSNTGIIPQVQSTNNQLLLDSKNNMTVTFTSDAPIEKVTNSFKWNIALFFTGNHKVNGTLFEYSPLDMQVSAGVQKPAQQKNTNPYKIQTTSASSDKIIHILYNNSKIMYFSAWEGVAKYNDSSRRLSATANAIAKNPEAGWFDDYDTKVISVDETEYAHIMYVSWRNETKDPSEMGYIFTLPRDGEYIKVQTFINGTKELYGVAPGFSAKDYDIYLSDGTHLENDRKTTYLEYPQYEVFHKNGSAIFAYSPSLVYMRNMFTLNVFRPVFIYPSDPLYIRYMPQVNITTLNNGLMMDTPGWSGTVDDFLNVSERIEPDPEHVMMLQGKIVLDPVEIRGPVYNLSKGNSILVDGSKFPGFGSKLNIDFADDGVVKSGDALYTATMNTVRRGWFLDRWYQSLDPDRANLLAHIYNVDKEKQLKLNESWTLAQGYEVTPKDISNNLILFELTKNGKTVMRDVVRKGNYFTFDISLDNRNVTILSFKLDDILNNNNASRISIVDLNQYADDPIVIHEGDTYGNGKFEVTGITDTKITVVNKEPLTFSQGHRTLIFDDTIGFTVANGSYNASVFMNKRYSGTHRAGAKTYNVNTGQNIEFNSTTFPGFHYDLDNDTVYEKFEATFSNDGEISTAKYTAYIHDNTTWFMGQKSLIFDGVLTSCIFDSQQMLYVGEALLLKEGYSLLLSDISHDSNSALLTLYKNDRVIEQQLLNTGETLDHTKKISDADITVTSVTVKSIFRGANTNIAQVDIKQYTDNADQLKVNDKYGSFKIILVDQNKIVLQNTEKITMPLNKVTTILDNYLKFQVEKSRYYGYPFVELKARITGSI